MENMKQIIFDLENSLLQPDVRKSPGKLNELISDDFVEYGTSGTIYNKSDILRDLPTSPEIKCTITDFKINTLSSTVVQSLFKTEKIFVSTGQTIYSLRSSIWKNENGAWKMMFHQGTPYQP